MRSSSLLGAPLRATARTATASSRRLRTAPARRPRSMRVRALLDYVASVGDDGVLRLPARTELDPDELRSVFGYPRKLEEAYFLGKVIGAGSFGTVREAVEAGTGSRYAIKTVSKIPKRGPPTPRCAAVSGLPASVCGWLVLGAGVRLLAVDCPSVLQRCFLHAQVKQPRRPLTREAPTLTRVAP